jgi:prepilin signal peptidase PulO-like enzyme (type II secretory pathway)
MNQLPEHLLFCIFIIFAVPISIIDLCSRRIPDRLSIPCFFLLLLTRIMLAPQRLPGYLAAALFGFLLFYCVRAVTKGLGLGDVKFAAVIGLFCGFPCLLTAFLIAALLGIAATLLPCLRINGRPYPLPFAPFLSIGAIMSYGMWRYMGVS